MSLKVSIKTAQESDLPYMREAFNRLNQIHHVARPDQFKPPEEIAAVKNLTKYLTKPDCFAFIANLSGRPVGFIAGHVRDLVSPITKTVKMGSIDELFIEEANRSAGVGSLLFTAVAEKCQSLGASDLFVEIWDFNETAKAFYKKQGLQNSVIWARKTLSDTTQQNAFN